MNSITFDMAILVANDYINVIDSDNKIIVAYRYDLMLNAIKAYNETCQRCNNSPLLVLDCEGMGKPFSLTIGKCIR